MLLFKHNKEVLIMKAEFIYENIMKSPEVLTKFLEYNFIKIKNVDIITIDEFYSEYEKLDSFEKLQMDNSKIALHHDWYNRATTATMTNTTLYTDYIVPNKWNIFVQLMEKLFAFIFHKVIKTKT